MKKKNKINAAGISAAKFNALPRSQRAVLVAQDVIQHIERGLLTITTGNYFQLLNKRKNHLAATANLTIDAKKAFLNKEVHCEVCGRGALFISAICFRNELTLGQAYNCDFGNDRDTGSATKYMRKEFSKHQQALIEMAFENNTFYAPDSERDYNYVIRWRESILRECRERLTKLPAYQKQQDAYLLIKICENIIENNGTFKPKVPTLKK